MHDIKSFYKIKIAMKSLQEKFRSITQRRFIMDFITYEQEGFVGVITINRPKALNALNSGVLDERTLVS